MKKDKDQKDNDQTLVEVLEHYHDWNDDNEKRRVRDHGWNEIIDAYNGQLPADWPYYSVTTDPIIRTILLEKKARLTNSKLRGRTVPREGSDVLKARLVNTLLDFQWDSAIEGGTMNAKVGEMDMDGRMFGSAFAYVGWKYETDKDGKVIFNGNELKPLDPNNSGLDPNCTHIRDANWFQMREYMLWTDLEEENEFPGAPKYSGLTDLKTRIDREKSQNQRDTDFQSRNLQLKGLEDRVGYDKSFPVIEIVTEFRKDRWITFSPKYNVILRDIKNPYKHRSIPIIQLRYYNLLNDPWGESEVECVLPIFWSIQATLCGYLDTMNISMRPPLKVIEGQVRMETLNWGPEATWIMNSPDAVVEHQSSGDALKYFQTTYSALKSALNQAMGEMSQGTGGVDPFNPEKTATEIKATVKQQNARDESNQSILTDMIQDMMRMWISNNQQFLFADPDMSEYILRIVGQENFDYFKRSGLDQMTIPDEAMESLAEIIALKNGDMSDLELQQLTQASEVPMYPVIENPNEKNVMKQEIKPKLRPSPLGDSAELSLVPDDLSGMYDYIPDVKSMSMGAYQEQLQSLNKTFEMLTNPQVLTMLQSEGVTPNVKDLIGSILEASGLRDTERYFKEAQASPGIQPNMAQPGLSGAPAAIPPGGEQMAGPQAIQEPGGLPMGIPGVMGQGAGVQGANQAPPGI
jgi:hypothetical protein